MPEPTPTSPPTPPALSLRTLILLLVAVPLILVSTILVLLLVLTSTRVSEQLGRQLGESAIDSVRTETKAFLAPAVSLSDLYNHRLTTTHTLSPTDLDGWTSTLLEDLHANPSVASICFATPDGNTVWLLRNAGRLEFGRSKSPAENDTREWIISPPNSSSADASLTPLRTYTYAATQRPWFKIATANKSPLWTPIYFWFPDQSGAAVTGTGYTRSVHSPDGTFLGVLVIDVTLASLSEFLTQLPLARDGALFLVDDQSMLVAASDGPTNASATTRHTLNSSTSLTANALSPFLSSPPTSNANPPSEIKIGIHPVRVLCAQLAPFPGIDWKLLVSLPEATFMTEARSAQRSGTLVAIAAAILLIALSLFLSRLLTQPLLTLTAHIRKIGSGDLSARLHLSGTREFHQLSSELNTMSAELKERTGMKHAMELATQFQQSLLPKGKAAKSTLDVHSLSRPSPNAPNQTDIIETLDLGGDGVLVAIGILTGHGPSADLLTVTARAALRSAAASGAPLGQVLSRVNAALTSDLHDVRFTATALVLVDPILRRARWAAPSHDPVLLFDPTTDTFTELAPPPPPAAPTDSPQSPLPERHIDNLSPSSILLLGTDRLIEARSPANLHFGKQPLQHLIRTHAHEPSTSLASAIDSAHKDFTSSAPLKDPITLVLIKLPS